MHSHDATATSRWRLLFETKRETIFPKAQTTPFYGNFSFQRGFDYPVGLN
jgi:hypothetical protein